MPDFSRINRIVDVDTLIVGEGQKGCLSIFKPVENQLDHTYTHHSEPQIKTTIILGMGTDQQSCKRQSLSHGAPSTTKCGMTKAVLAI